MSTTPDPARGRFFVITAMRFTGVAVAFAGIAIIVKRWLEPAELIGGVFIIFGLLNTIVVPAILIKAWRTPK